MLIGDHHLFQVYQLSLRLSKITGLQVTIPKLRVRQHEIANIDKIGPFKAADPFKVRYFMSLFFKMSFH